MDEQVLAKLEAWLRYFEDMGIDAFDCRGSVTAAAATPASQPLPPTVTSAPAPQAPRRPGATAAAKPAEPSAAPRPAPILTSVSASLFETAERVEGDTLERIRADIGECTRCKLHESRHRIVFGDGSARAELVFVGEGPGEEEDRQGLPFVGRAGKLLTQMIEAMGLERRSVYICNVVKCRPPNNRTPERDEMATCQPFLERQLAVIQPKVIVCLGNIAMQALLGTSEPMSRVRGKWFGWHSARLLPTYHPAYLLRNPSAKAVVWEDLQKVMAELGLNPPKRPGKRP